MKTPPPRKVKTAPADMDFEIPRGQRLHKIGNLIRNGGKTYRCEKVSASNATFQNIKNASDIEHFSNCYDADQILPSSEGEQTNETNNEENNMSKKNTTKENGKPGKIEFIDELLQAGKHTKPEVQALAAKKFPGIGKNTTNWACSTMKKRTGKVSKHLPTVKAEKKPAAKKSKPTAKKSPPNRKPAAPVVAETTAEPVAA